MKKFGCLIILLLVSTFVGNAEPLQVRSVCDMAVPQTVRVFNWETWDTSFITDQSLLFEPFHWDVSRNIWQGYKSAQPFNQPADANRHWSVTLIQENGTQQWIYILDSLTTPDTDYVYVFQTVIPHLDRHGEHYGIHACRAFAAAEPMVTDWLRRVYHVTSESLTAQPLRTA